MSSDLIKPVILSGGSGTRLWPSSTPARPKQFLPLTSDLTMLQLTVERVAAGSGFRPPMIVANARHESEIHRQMAAHASIPFDLVLEPAARNTAPAIALAALRSAPEDLLLVMPSDHVIRDSEGFRNAVASASQVARAGHLVTFGIAPTGPETGYGYIKKGSEIAPAIWRVERFVEKPDRSVAERYVAGGDHVWNAGIFLFRAGDFLDALRLHAPDVLDASDQAVKAGQGEGGTFRPDPGAFARAPSISIDYAVMEKADKVAVASLDVGWSDIGSWDALYEFLAAGGRDNVMDAGAIQIDCSGTMLKSAGPRIAAIGLEDIIVVAAADAILVMRRGESQRVKEVLARLEAGGT